MTTQTPDVPATLGRARLVPVVVLDDAADAGPLADALVAGGLPVAEVTFRIPAAADAIRATADRGDLLLGAGTVLTPAQVDQAVAAAARYVVSPGPSRAIFPAGTSGGAPAIAALAAPFAGVRFVPTGGVGPADLADYLRIDGVVAVGGSWMVPRDRIRAGDFETVRRLTGEAVALARDASGRREGE